MPVQPCMTEDGKRGRKWGRSGKCYPCRRKGNGWDCGEAARKANVQGYVVEKRSGRR